jgi:transposase
MEVLYSRCAGLDVHKDTVVACARWIEGGKGQYAVETFETVTSELLRLADWLMEHGCTHVAMEATGVYWRPVWAILEAADAFELMLANAAHVKNVPGRKTDVNDATWLADLLAHGLIKPSFVPPAHVQQTRELSRTRKQLVQEVTSHTLRIQKVLETCNIKLSSLLSDVRGKSGRAILDAIIDGEDDPKKLAALVDSRVRASQEQLVEALKGRVTAHHRFLLKIHMTQADQLEEAVRDVEARLGDALKPFREKLARVAELPGLDTRSASAIVSEIGFDMKRFETPDKLVSWATLCPRMDETAGKRRNTRIRKGGTWLKPVLVQAAWNAVRTKKSYLRAKYLRLKSRRGAKKAIVAVAASMLRAIWHILSTGSCYQDLGPDYQAVDKEKLARRLCRRLEQLGYKVTLPVAA